MRYLIIRISLLVISLLNTCGETIGEPRKIVNHIYKNDTDTKLSMEVYNRFKKLIYSYDIEPGNQINTHTSKTKGSPLFYYSSDNRNIGDSIVVQFASDKCLYYRGRNDRIFDERRYDNYSEELVAQSKFELIYIFK